MEDTKDETGDLRSQICQEERDGWQSLFQERPLRVLLVEDDVLTRQVVRALLLNCGYEVSTATDGANAWVILEGSRCKFDLVLADAMILFVSGVDLLSKIVKSEVHGDIPVIMMSSQDSMDVVLKCLLKGAKDFLVKPLRRNEIRNLWQHVWRRNHLSSSRAAHRNAVSERRKITTTHGPAIPSCFTTEANPPSCDPLAGRSTVCESATEVLQQASDMGPTQLHANTPTEDSIIDQLGMTGSDSNDHALRWIDTYGGISTQDGDSLGTVDGSEASERSAKAMDLIGTMMSDPPKVECLIGSPIISTKDSPRNGIESSIPLVSELTLKRSISIEAERVAFNAMKGLKHSKGSAFSTYSSHLLPQQYQQCLDRSASPPSQFSICDSSSTLPFPCETMPSTLASPAERFNLDGSRGLSTLYFPQAIRLCKYESDVNSELSMLVSCDSSGTKRKLNNVNSELSMLVSCDSSGTKRKLNNDMLLGTDGLLPTARECKEQEDSHLCALSDAEVVIIEEKSAKVGKGMPITACDLASGPVSTRLCNSVTSKGSCSVMYETGEGRDCSVDQLNQSLEDIPRSNFSSVQKCNQLATAEQRKSHCSMIQSDGCGATSREVALHKFRQKRKVRCFDKKVRYESRKQLADQRPRVKGQFVRQATYDASMAKAIN